MESDLVRYKKGEKSKRDQEVKGRRRKLKKEGSVNPFDEREGFRQSFTEEIQYVRF